MDVMLFYIRCSCISIGVVMLVANADADRSLTSIEHGVRTNQRANAVQRGFPALIAQPVLAGHGRLNDLRGGWCENRVGVRAPAKL